MKLLFTKLLLVLTIVASAQNFTELNGPSGGNIQTIQIGPDGKVYALDRIGQQIYSSADNGVTWLKFGPVNADVYTFLIDGSTFYYTDYSSLYSSTNGTTWTRVGSGFRNPSLLAKHPTKSNTFVVGAPCEGVYVSSNNGAGWTKLTTNNGCGSGGRFNFDFTANGDLYFHDNTIGLIKHPVPSDDVWSSAKTSVVFPKETSSIDTELNLIIRSSDSKIFLSHRKADNSVTLLKTSTNGGSSWNPLASPSGNINGYVTWSEATNGIIYTLSNGNFHQLSNETVPTWTLRTKPNTDFVDYNIATITWKSATEAYAGCDGSGIYRTTDGGSVWTQVNGTWPNAINSFWGSDIEIMNNGNIVVRGDNGVRGFWVSQNQTTFTHQKPTSASPFFYGALAQQKLVKLQDGSLINSSSEGTFRTTDGLTWTKITTEGSQVFLPVGPTEIIGFGMNGSNVVKRSIDNGANWTNVTISGWDFGFFFMYATKIGNNFIASGYTNTNGGRTEYWRFTPVDANNWNAVKLVTPLESAGFNCRGLFELNGKVYASDGNRFAYSGDQGSSWTSINYSHDYMIPIRQGVGGVGLGVRASILVTQDDGKSWKSFSLPSRNAYVRDIAQDAGNNSYIVCYGGSVAKITSPLIVAPDQIPPAINFTWQALNGPYGGYVNKLAKATNGTLFSLGSNNGLYRYNNGTAKWERISIPNSCCFREIKSYNNKIYVVDYSSIIESSDNGNTWTRLPGQVDDIGDIAVSSNGTLIIATNNSGVYTSSNNGNTFTSVASLNTGFFGFVESITGGFVLAAKEENGVGKLYRSADNGTTWSQVTNIDLEDGIVRNISKLEDGALAVVTKSNVFKTTNGGSTWTSIKGNGTFTVHPNGAGDIWRVGLTVNTAGHYYFSNLNELHISTNGGSTWTKKNGINGTNLFEPVFDATGALVMGSNNNGFYITTNNGDSFTLFSGNSGFTSTNPNSMALNNGQVWVAGGGGNFFGSTNAGASFTKISNITYTDAVLKKSNGEIVAYGGGISVSSDGGATWSNKNADGFFSQMNSLKTADPNVDNFFAIRINNNGRKVVRSTDLTSWTELSTTNVPNFYIDHIAALPDNTVFFTTSGNLYRVRFGSIDQLSDFNNVGSVTQYDNKIFVYERGGSFLESTDGINWSRKSAPNNGGVMSIGANGYIFINNSASSTLWISRDQGNTWQSAPGFTNVYVSKIDIDESSGIAYAAIHGREVHKSSSIVIPNDNAAPLVQTLSPLDDATGVAANFKLVLTFQEAIKAVSTRKVKLIDVANSTLPVQEFDATAGVLSNGNKTVTFTPTASIGFLKNYAVVIDAGAFTDIFGNAFAGYSNLTAWSFTTLDNQAPTLQHTAANFTKGTPLTLQVTVQDNGSINSSQTILYYRKIGAPSTTPFIQATNPVENSGGTAFNKTFNFTVSESWYDELGLEYYFTSQDLPGNTGRSPETTAAYHYSYTIYPTTSKPKIENLVFGETANSYRMIAIPQNLRDNQVATIFDELGEAKPGNWRLLTYSGTEVYDQYPKNFDKISRGKGYWFLQKTFNEIFIENSQAITENRSSAFKITLQSGWNQIGNPYPVEITWPTGNGTLKRYTNGNYSNTTTLNPYEGAFVFNSGGIKEVTISPGATAGTGRTESITSDLSAQNWELPIAIRQGSLSNTIGGIGMNINGSLELDNHDDFNPPGIAGKLALDFDIKNYTLTKNVVTPKNYHEWDFVAYAENDGLAELLWDNTQFGINENELYLFDHKEQRLTNMRETNIYTFDDKQRKFTIYFGQNLEGKILPSLGLLGDAYPNPSSQAVTIPFTIADKQGNSQISISIINNLGEPVQNLVNKTFQPGFYTISWDTQTTQTKPGLYFYKMKVTDSNGKTYSQTKKIILQ